MEQIVGTLTNVNVELILVSKSVPTLRVLMNVPARMVMRREEMPVSILTSVTKKGCVHRQASA